jgi:hypothetical protein
MTNLGQVHDVVTSGHIAPHNFYPVTHILLANAATISGLQIDSLSNLGTGAMSIFFVGSTYLLGRVVLKPRDRVILAAAVASVAFNGYDVFLMPAGWSIFFLPLVILVFLRSRDSGDSNAWRVAFIALLVVYPFFHPLSCLFLALCLTIFGALAILARRVRLYPNPGVERFYAIPWRHVLLLLAILLPWLLSFQTFRPNLLSLYESVVTGTSPSFAHQIGETLGKINVGLLGFVTYLIKTMGDDIMFLLMAVLVIFQIRRTGGFLAFRNVDKVWLLGVILVTGAAFGLYLFNVVPGLGSLSADRFLMYAVVFSPVLAASFLGQYVNRRRLKRVLASVLSMMVLLGASILSVFSLYPSPYTMVPNAQVSHMDEEVYDWLFRNSDTTIPITSILSSPDRYGDMILGTVGWSDRFVSVTKPPDHLGFDKNGTQSTWVNSETYLVLSKIDRQAYVSVWKAVGRFNDKDFQAMSNNSYLAKVYSNGESETWLVHSS